MAAPAAGAPGEQPALRPAGIVTRGLASGIDAVVLSACFAGVVFGLRALGAVLLVKLPAVRAMGEVIQALAGAALIPAYHLAFWSLAGWTPGKRLLGIRVIGPDGRPPGLARSALRFAAYTVSISPLLAGVLAIAFDPRRRAWHDRIARTQVVHDPPRTRTPRVRVRVGPHTKAVASLWLALSIGCVRRLEVPPPNPAESSAAARADLPASVLVLPVRVSLRALERLLEERLPGTVESPEWEAVGEGPLNYRYELERGAIQLEVEGDRLVAKTRVRYGAAVCVRMPGLRRGGDRSCLQVASCGMDGGGPRPEVNLVLSSRMGLSPEWSLETHTAIDVSVVEPCRITFLRVDVTPFLDEAVGRAAAEAAAGIDAHVAELTEPRAEAARAWAVLSRPIEVKPDVHLLLRPRGLALSRLRGDGDEVELTLAVRARPLLVAGPAPSAERRPLPPLGTTARPRPRFRIALEGKLPYQEASRVLAARLEGRRFEARGSTITIRKIEVVSASGRAVLRAELEARSRCWRRLLATVYLAGDPVYEPDGQVLAVKDVDYTATTRSALVAGLEWLLSDPIRRGIQDAARFELGDAIAKARSELERALNRELAPGVRLSGSAPELELLELFQRDGRFVVRLAARGKLSVKVRDAPAGRER
jgi:uncharacterized RDD family membrane protein YckC